ncbi:MAG: HAD-IA family hydrolase [Bauldia sp.]
MTPPLLVFDLDGTLIDTAGDLTVALNRVLAEEGLAPVKAEDARAMIGTGALALVKRGFAASGRAIAPEKEEHLFQRFLLHYRAKIADLSRPYPGCLAALDRFAAAGWRLAVCTNKLESLSLQLFDTLGLTSRFAAIAGADTFGVRKPDPAMLFATIRRAGGDPKATVMVGDSMTDVSTAKAASVPVVAVDFGYTDIPPSEFPADALISHYDALWDAVARIRSGAAVGA